MIDRAYLDRNPEPQGAYDAAAAAVSDVPETASHLPPGTSAPTQIEGRVIAIAHGYFEVAAGDDSYLCTLRGRLRSAQSRPHPTQTPARAGHPLSMARRGAAVGRGSSVQERQRKHLPVSAPENPDREAAPVRIAPGERVLLAPLGSGQGIIEAVLPRTSVLSRSRSEAGGEHVMLANLDHAVLVFAVREPEPHLGMLDRYLALCEHAGIAVSICLNKIDLEVSEDIERAAALYANLGYGVLLTSAATGTGIEVLRARLAGRVSLLTGPSGVGKSSLMNALLPHAAQRTAQISEATGKGRHTTTGARLLPLGDGGWLADSAGIRELALWNVPVDALPAAFVELRAADGQCEYENCDHSAGSDGCALRAVLDAGGITPERFASFERLQAEARATEQPRR